MTPRIPFEIINNVLSNFSQDGGIRSLFPYLLVNRDWCQASLSYIWAKPFHGLSHGKHAFISTYLSCLSRSRLTNLKSQGLDLSSVSQPIFNYSAFLKQLDYSEFLLSVVQWYNLKKSGDSDNEKISAVIRSLLHLFCESSVYLNTLIIQTNGRNIHDEEYFSILIEDEFKDMMSPIKRIAVHTHFKMEKFFSGLSKHCRNVRNLNIGLHGYESLSYGTQPSFNNSVSASLWISSQTHLKSLTIDISCWDTSPLIKSLLSQKKTIKYLKFNYVNFKNCESLKEISECENLEILEFRRCRDLKEMVEDLISHEGDAEEGKERKDTQRLKKLKTLKIGNDFYELERKT